MRAVALSDKKVQARIARSYVPLKVAIEPGTPRFPLDWPALEGWSKVYQRLGGEKNQGITFASVVSPDLEVEYASTGSAMVWELFDSIAYDAAKFGAMLDRGAERAAAERRVRADPKLGPDQRARELARLRRRIARALRREGRFRLPPPGFTVEGAVELFKMSGDLPGEDGESGASAKPEQRRPRLY